MIKPCTYKIINILTNKYYFGSSKSVKRRFSRHKYELKNNKHHCLFLQRSYNKHGCDNFKYQIDKEFNTIEEARKYEEQYLLNNYDNLYNTSKKASGGDLLSYHPNKDEIIKKRSNTLKKIYSEMSKEEKCIKYGKKGEKNGMYGKKRPPEIIEILKKTHIGNKYRLGKKATEETRQKLSKVASERIGEKNPFYGRKHTEELKEKMRNLRKGRKPTNMRKVKFNNIIYESVTDCARKNNCSPATIIYRIKQNKACYLEGAETS